MQVAQAKHMRIVDNNGIGVGDVEPRFDNGGGNQHIVIATNEIEHGFFQQRRLHLPVGNNRCNIWAMLLNHRLHVAYPVHPIVDKEYLPSSIDLIFNGLLNDLHVERVKFGNNGVSVWRRGVDNGQIACSHQRELKCSRDRCGCKGKGIHVQLQLFQLLLGCHSKLLLFVNNYQPHVLKHNVVAQQGMSPNENVYFPFGQPGEGFLLLFGRFQAADKVNCAGKVGKALAKSLVVLECQYGGGYQNSNLLAIGYRFESGTYGHLGFSKAHIATNQPVHWNRFFHILFQRLRCLHLIGSILVDKRGFQLFLQVGVG